MLALAVIQVIGGAILTGVLVWLPFHLLGKLCIWGGDRLIEAGERMQEKDN